MSRFHITTAEAAAASYTSSIAASLEEEELKQMPNHPLPQGGNCRTAEAIALFVSYTLSNNRYIEIIQYPLVNLPLWPIIEALCQERESYFLTYIQESTGKNVKKEKAIS